MVLLASIGFGLIWNIVAVSLMGGRLQEALAPGFMIAGAAAGAAAGWFTIWSRVRRAGRESVALGIATYYLGMVVYWAVVVVNQRVILCIQHGGWTDFDLRDHLLMIVLLLVHGTVWAGILLIPLWLLIRRFLWWLYDRGPSRRANP